MKKLNDLVSDYRKENERFVEKVSKLQQKLTTNSSGIATKNDLPIKEKLHESTTSYFSDEDEAVREFAFGKIRNNDFEDMYDNEADLGIHSQGRGDIDHAPRGLL